MVYGRWASAPSFLQLGHVGGDGLLQGQELGPVGLDLGGVPGHGRVGGVDVGVEQPDLRGGGRPAGQRLGRGELGEHEDDLGHHDDQGRGGQCVPLPHHRHQGHDPGRQVDEGGDRVEDGEQVVGVPGDNAHGRHHGQGGHDDPQDDGDPQRQAPHRLGVSRARSSAAWGPAGPRPSSVNRTTYLVGIGVGSGPPTHRAVTGLPRVPDTRRCRALPQVRGLSGGHGAAPGRPHGRAAPGGVGAAGVRYGVG